MYDNLFSEVKIGNLTLQNRIAMAAMGVCVAEGNGDAGERFAAYYEERAKGGTGLIITEVTRVNDTNGVALPGQLSMASDARIPAFAKTVKRVHKHGTKIFVQLHHPGRQNLSAMGVMWPMLLQMNKFIPHYFDLMYSVTSKVPISLEMLDSPLVALGSKMMPPVISASNVPVGLGATIIKGQPTRALTKREIKKLEKQFIDAAGRVKKAGADGVELHASHGYLIQQFLSPYTNQRTDEYGGSLENRMRFLLNIIAGIREKCGKDFPIMVRLTVDEFYDTIGFPGRGIQLAEGVEMAKRLEKAGIDAIDVSCGNYETLNTLIEPISAEPGWRSYLAKAVKDAVNIPVMAVGVIRDPDQAEALLESGNQDIIGLGRPLIADPHWAKKAKAGHPELIQHCICCCTCFETDELNALAGQPCECALNPTACRENKFLEDDLKKVGKGKNVVVVGAGPAGLTAARVAAKRGFHVTLLEKCAIPGGQLILAAAPPHKDKMNWAISDLYENAKAAGVEFKFGTEATKDTLKALKPYAIILATGGASIKPNIPGCDKPHVCTTTEILDGTINLTGKNVAVIGSGMTGLETAELIASQGNHVTVVEMAKQIAPGTYSQHVWDVVPRLEKVGTNFITSHKLVEVTDDAIRIEAKDGNIKTIGADQVVLSLGVKSVNPLAKDARAITKRTTVIGDATTPGRIVHATRSAFQAAIKLK